MTQPNLLGHDNLFNRDVFLAVMDRLNPELLTPRPTGQFACLCILDGRGIDALSILEFCRALIRLGCAYLCCWGPDCERVHDLMDSEVMGGNPPETDIGCVMTTSHANDSLEDAVDFFLACTYPDKDYAPRGCEFNLVIVVDADGWAQEVKQLLTEKLDGVE